MYSVSARARGLVSGFAAGVLAVSLTGLAGCSAGGKDDDPKAVPSSPPTPLADFDTTGVSFLRGDFCSLIPKSAAERAIGGPVERATSYSNGEKGTLATGVSDVAHEFGCSYRSAGGTLARAWVFAPPVTPGMAKRLVAMQGKTKGCTTPAKAPPFGDPTVALVCKTGSARTATYSGLFVDAWLSCSLTAKSVPAKTLLDRAGEWCVAVVSSAATGS